MQASVASANCPDGGLWQPGHQPVKGPVTGAGRGGSAVRVQLPPPSLVTLPYLSLPILPNRLSINSFSDRIIQSVSVTTKACKPCLRVPPPSWCHHIPPFPLGPYAPSLWTFSLQTLAAGSLDLSRALHGGSFLSLRIRLKELFSGGLS